MNNSLPLPARGISCVLTASLATFALVACTASAGNPSPAAPVVAPAPSEVAFDSSFESGNATNFRQIDENTWSFEIEPDSNANDRQWYYFSVSGAEGRTLTFHILNIDRTNVRSHWNHAWPVFSTDGGSTWDRVTGPASRTDDTFVFSHDFEFEGERIAFHVPYTWTMMQEKLAEWNGAPHLESETIGRSVQGRPIEFLRITDASVPEEEKIGVWVLGRQHSAETTSSFSVEAFIDFALSDHPDADALRRGAVLNIVPMVNPDGVVLGNYRQNARGVNLNRVWNGTATAEDSPEVLAVEERLEAWIAAGKDYSLFIDFHSTAMGAAPHFAFHGGFGVDAPRYHTPEEYHDDLRRYLTLVEKHAPHFDATRGETTSNNQALAYHRQRLRHGVLAMTPEGTFNRQNHGPTPEAFMMEEEHRSVEIGRAHV